MTDLSEKNITVAIYSHPEYYPPMLNAIDGLSGIFKRVQVITRNLRDRQWDYPQNVDFFASGKYVDIRASEQSSTWWKLNSFLHFTLDFYKTLSREKQEWVICNDTISLYAYRLVRPFLRIKPRLWYHSHDVTEIKSVRKYSIGYFSARSEARCFNRIDLFTLPSEARLEFYPVKNLKGKWMIIPNYPSIRRMGIDQKAVWVSGTDLKLIYQGRISDEHGLEEIIGFLKNDPALRLTIIGPGGETYIQSLKNKISSLGIQQQVSILDPVPYKKLKEITLQHQVGMAINKPVNILYQTAAMASNKIYEYAAAALPVLYFNDEHYNERLGKYSWAFPTDLSELSLRTAFKEIRADYRVLSDTAQTEFKDHLNFEKGFKQVLTFISAQNRPEAE